MSGHLHTIEIWFVAHDGCAYLMAGSDRSDWLRNLAARPRVRLRIGEVEVDATASVVADPSEPCQAEIRNRMADKYGEREDDGSLNSWARRAVVVAVCPDVGAGDAPVA